MLGHSVFLLLAAPVPCPLAYVGLGPGQEFIPYFFALLGLVGTALVAALQRPAAALLAFLSRARGRPPRGPNRRPAAADAPEEAGEGTRDEP